MIHRDQVNGLLLEACPSFQKAFSASDNPELPYMIAGEFARHLLDLHRANMHYAFPAVFSLIEMLHCDGDAYVKELATIGFLEGIQNVWSNNHCDPEEAVKWLQPVSRKWWDSLNKFWTGEIEYVGADVKHPITSSFAFGNSPEIADDRARKVVDGRKTATSQPLLPGEALPIIGERHIILDGSGRDVAVIEITEVAIVTFQNVGEAHALAEGYGSLDEWRVFKETMFRQDGIFDEAMPVVCQRFRVVEVR